MLDYTKNDSYRLKLIVIVNIFFFCFHANFVPIGVLRYKGRFGLDYTLVSSKNIPKIVLTNSCGSVHKEVQTKTHVNLV